MTDNEIMKALKCCVNLRQGCSDCPYLGRETCAEDSVNDAVDLIQRQQAEITLKTEYIQEQRDVIAELKDKIESFADRIVEQLEEEQGKIYKDGVHVANEKSFIHIDDAIAIVEGVQNENL